jgi:hypothetical protein
MLSEEDSGEKKEEKRANIKIEDNNVEGYEGDTRLSQQVDKDKEGYEGDGRLSRRFDRLKRR